MAEAEVGGRKVGKREGIHRVVSDFLSLHLPSEGMIRRAHGMRHIWVGVVEGDL